MAGARPARPKSTSRQREAHRLGSTGRNLTPGLSSLAENDPSIDAAHDAGRDGADFDDFAGSYYEPERRLERPSPRAPRSGGDKIGGARGGSSGGGGIHFSDVTGDGAGLLLGAIAYALVLSLITNGASGPLMWFKAKFLNQTKSQPNGVPNKVVKAATGSTPSVNSPGAKGGPPGGNGSGSGKGAITTGATVPTVLA